jgi:FkbM family methyltransferase
MPQFMRKATKLLQLLRRRVWRRGLAHGSAAAVEHTRFLAAHSFGTVLDVGANVGQFSLAVRAIQPKARIIAFEPLSEAAARFDRVFSGDSGTTLVRRALGSQPNEAIIHISRRADASSLLPIALIGELYPGVVEEVATRPVEVETLDSCVNAEELRRPVLLKLDVQGFELEALKGATRTLPSVDHIFAEVSFFPLYEGQPLASEIIKWLAERDFELAGVYHISFDRAGRSVQADMHFSRGAPPRVC